MKTILEIEDVYIEEKDSLLLNHIFLYFYENTNTFICGTSGSGKTLLLKSIAKKVKYHGKINRKVKTEVVFNKTSFFSNSLEDEFCYLNLDDSQKEIISYFIADHLLQENPNFLDEQMKKIVLFCKALIQMPDLLFVDNLFSFLNPENKEKLFNYLKDNHITLVSVSTHIDEAVNYDYMIVLDQGKVAIEGKTLQVLQEEKLLKRLGIGLPFYIDLSIQLKLYGLIDKIFYNKEDLVKELWK